MVDPRILIVDDDPDVLGTLNTILLRSGYRPVALRDSAKARDLILAQPFDLIVCDLRMAPVTGLQLLELARSRHPDTLVIMVTAYGSVESAVAALKLGAFDYVTKPFAMDELLITISRALEYRNLLNENRDLKAELYTRYRIENIIAESAAMKRVCEIVERVAPSDATVLLYGESGTGKEVVAKALHALSRRKSARFLAINCAAIPAQLLESEMFGHVRGAFTDASTDKKGLFEATDGGTLMLDEIGSLPLAMQGKLLRVLQEKEVRRVGGNETIPIDVRIIAATNIPLETLIGKGEFREDLFYRLSVIPITIEPLRNRRADIVPLAEHFLRQEGVSTGHAATMTPDVRTALESYEWPGNVRELENAVKHAVTFAQDNRITVECLPAWVAKSATQATSASAPAQGKPPAAAAFFTSLADFTRSREEEYILQVLESVNGDKEEASRILGVSIATFYRKLPRKAAVPGSPAPTVPGAQ